MPNAAGLLGDEVEFRGSMLEAVTGADAAVIVTEWGEFRGVHPGGARGDADAARGRRAQPARPGEVRAAGFAYESVGRPSDPSGLLRAADADVAAP